MTAVPRVRAPREHGSLLAVPALEQAGPLLDRNRTNFDDARLGLLGAPLDDLRHLARRETLAAARAYFAEAGEPFPAATGDTWLLAGHQSELFHPGVWVKNFALAKLARKHRAVALNLVVDNDTAKTALLRLPHDRHLARVPFDRAQGEIPYEERTVADEALFASLPERVAALTADWPFAPMLPAFWQQVLRQASRTPLLGERFAAARRHCERAWGCHNAEVPLSRLCQTEAFARFAGHLIDQLPRLHTVYNEAVHDYRRRHGIKSRHHPVPDLSRDGDWLEAPLWAWRGGQERGRRAKLFVRRRGAAVELRADGDAWPSLDFYSPEAFVAAWRTLEPRGYKVRTRALTTTLFARLLLGDLFLHGIGGGKYDELTDALCERFFGLPAPAFLILSATLHLPFPRAPASPDDCRRLTRAARDLVYNPQRHLPADVDAAARAWARTKAELIAGPVATRDERVARFEALRRVNAALQPYLDGQRGHVRQALATCRQLVATNALHGRRDFAFCLYPEAMLREVFQRLPV